MPQPSGSEHGVEDVEKPEYERTNSRIGMRRKATQTLEEKKKRFWNVFKKWKEGEESDWWFASTGIPLLAATLGPLANVTSIAALVTSWRQNNLHEDSIVPDFKGVPYADPRWCYWINVASLITGFLGNLFLLLNFTRRIRYTIALPATIVLWYISSGFLIAITSYTQGFWYGIAAASFYLICSILLMVNMLGFYLGHYPDNFDLSDSQRTLILQTMTFFVWLGGGAAVFSKLETQSGESGWNFANALYFCDVTILTVGFGDLVPTTDVTRGIVFPYSVGGIITLALIVSSLYKFVRELGEEKIVQKHIEHMRTRAIERTVTNSFDIRQREQDAHLPASQQSPGHPRISGPINPHPYRTAMGDPVRHRGSLPRLQNALKITPKPKLILLREEKDRFDAMRQIQADTKKFKRWMALFWSVATFSILWCVGAAIFWQTERDVQGLTYFQSLYFCYISLLTIGYGDLAPKTNAGRCFFVVWSLIAVPTMTILVSALGDTVVAKFKRWSDEVADFTVLPKEGIWRTFLEDHPWLLQWLQRRITQHAANKRLRSGFDTIDPNATTTSSQSANLDLENQPANPDPNDADPDSTIIQHPTLPSLAAEAEHDTSTTPAPASLSRRLALAIQKVSSHVRLPKPKRYTYEEWVEFTRLIRLTTPEKLDRYFGTKGLVQVESENGDGNEEGLVNWDWIGDDSPMMSGVSESEWLLERLCESLIRLERRKEVVVAAERVDSGDAVRRVPLVVEEECDEVKRAGEVTPG